MIQLILISDVYLHDDDSENMKRKSVANNRGHFSPDLAFS